MPLTLQARKNTLASCESPYVMTSRCSDVLEFDRLLDLMARKSGLQKPDLMAGQNHFAEELLEQLIDGKAVKTPIGTFFLHAKGRLSNEDEAFRSGSEAGHAIKLHYRPDPAFERALETRARVVRAELKAVPVPRIDEVRDLRRPEAGSCAPGSFARVSGQRLGFDPQATDEGAFLIAEDKSERRLNNVCELHQRSFLVDIPADCAPGSYALAVRARNGRKEVQEGRYPGLRVQ